MGTLAASAYFLTCCRPTYGSTFCFYIETPKLINLYHYPNDSLFQSLFLECSDHPNLRDHCLSRFNSCTDGRSWCQDDRQRRAHFLDAIRGRIPLCGYEVLFNKDKKFKDKEESFADVETFEDVETFAEVETFDPKAIERFGKLRTLKKNKQPEPVKAEAVGPTKSKDKTNVTEEKALEVPPTPPPSPRSEPPLTRSLPPSAPEQTPDELPIQEERSQEDVVELTDQIVDKLDNSLDNLEASFVNYVEKNKRIVQNLAEMLAFEKHKQKALEDNYRGLKQENDVLRTKIDYLKMVNFKQLELFRNELDKALTENKAVFKRKIYQLEMQLQKDNEELKSYKLSEKSYFEVMEKDNLELTKMSDEVKHLKFRESKLLNNYVEVLNFLHVLKEKLTNSSYKGVSSTTAGSEMGSKLKQVLQQALNYGMHCLNVRDLSIIHDAIQDINEDLCHSGCGRNQVSISHFSVIYGNQNEDYQPDDCVCKGYKDYDTPSNLSIYPSRQRPDKHLPSGYC